MRRRLLAFALQVWVVPSLRCLLRYPEETGGGRNVAMAGQLRQSFQQPLGGMSALGQRRQMRGEELVASPAAKLPQPHHQFDPLATHRQVPNNPIMTDVPFLGDAMTVRAQSNDCLGHERQSPNFFPAVPARFHGLEFIQVQ